MVGMGSLVHSLPVIINNGGCTQVFPTKGNSLYSHSEIFGAAIKPKDIDAFKYYCTNNLISFSLKDLELVS